MTSRMQMQKILNPVLSCNFFVFMYPTFWIIINVSNVNKIICTLWTEVWCCRLCLWMLCVFELHTILLLLSHRRPLSADVCKWIRTRSLHETKAKQIFFCTRLCGEKWPNGCSKAQQWTLRPLIRSMEGKYGAPTHAWTQKNQWKKSTKLAFWKTCHDEFTSCDCHCLV